MAASKKRGLGKGLDVLFGEGSAEKGRSAAGEKTVSAGKKEEGTGGEITVRTSLIVPRADQPRKTFDKESLGELAESVKKYGIIEPLIVKKKGASYELIAGERRWRAAQAAGLTEVPVIVRDIDKRTAAEIAIIENLQREDLNPVEEARAYEELMKTYGLSQEQVASVVSKSRTAVTNTLRLLKLDKRVIDLVTAGQLSAGHARALLSIEDGDVQAELADRIIAEGLSVRDVERAVRNLGRKPREKKSEDRDLSVFYKDYEENMGAIFGTKVRISHRNDKKGRVEIEYYSREDLDRIMEMFGKLK